MKDIPERREDGNWIRNIKFRFPLPILRDGKEVVRVDGISLDKEQPDEHTVTLEKFPTLETGSTTPSKADCRIPKQSNIRRAIGEHEKCNRKQQQDSGCGFRRQKRRLAIPFVFDKQ